MWYVSSQFVAEIETSIFPFPKLEADTVYWAKLHDNYQANNMRSKTSVKIIAQEINLEQVISPEMPRIVSPVILERDIEPSFYRLVNEWD